MIFQYTNTVDDSPKTAEMLQDISSEEKPRHAFRFFQNIFISIFKVFPNTTAYGALNIYSLLLQVLKRVLSVGQNTVQL